jgi:hypothetical protein
MPETALLVRVAQQELQIIALSAVIHEQTVLMLRYFGCSMAETDKPDADPVHERVDQVIQDMTAGRVIPRKVDELGTAVERAKRDQAVHRVTQKA